MTDSRLRDLAASSVAIADIVHRSGANDKLAQELRKGDRTLKINQLPATKEQLEEIATLLEDEAGPSSNSRAFSLQMSELMPGEVFGGLPRGRKDLMMLEAHWKSRWAHYGLPAFSLTDSLTATLLLTDPPNEFNPESLSLPFPVFVVTMPPGLVPLHLGDAPGWATMMIVHRHTTSVNGVMVDAAYVGMESDNGRRLYRVQPIQDLLRDEKALMQTGGDDDAPDIEIDNRSLTIGIRLVRNLAAWIEAHGTGSPEPRPKRGYTRRQREAFVAAPNVWVLNREVKLAPELRHMVADVANGEREGWKLRMRYCVRGHWRWQPCGEGRHDRKRIFIKPHWKGPEGAAAWQHVFTSKGSE